MLPLTAILAVVVLEAMPVNAASSPGILPKGAIVDLSHPYDAKTIFWPTESGFVLEPEHDGLTDKGYYYRSNKFSAPEHGGTHIDAPAHFAKDGNFVDAIPLDQLVGAAVVVDVSRKCQADRDYRIAIDDFRDWEKTHNEIPPHAIVLLRTGRTARNISEPTSVDRKRSPSCISPGSTRRRPVGSYASARSKRLASTRRVSTMDSRRFSRPTSSS
jgi:kynurenine formamidase